MGGEQQGLEIGEKMEINRVNNRSFWYRQN